MVPESSDFPLVSIVVVNWNGMHLLRSCLGSLRDQRYPHTEIVLVDNGSRDGSVEYTKVAFPGVKVIELAENLGFATANNIGIEATSGSLVVLVNNDTKALPEMVSAFVQAMGEDPRLGAAQGKIRLMRQPDLLDGGIGSFFSNTGFLVHVGHMQPDPGCRSRRIIFAGKGACLCLRREALERTRLFEEEFFAYFEDSDLCWRIWLAGYTVAYVPDAEILHALDSSNVLGGNASHASYSLINYHSFKNRIRTLTKNLGIGRLWFILPVHLVICVVLMAAYGLTLRPAIARGIAAALLWNLTHVSSTLLARRHVQRDVRRVSDAEVFEHTVVPLPLNQFVRSFWSYGGGLRFLHPRDRVEVPR